MNNTIEKIEIKVTQCEVGKFNLIGNEKSLSFYMGVYRDGQIVEEDGKKAQLYYSGEPDEESDFEDAVENLDSVFHKCYEYSHRVLSTTDRKANCMLFAKVYCENVDAIDAYMLQRHKEKIQKQIEELQKKLGWDSIVYDISSTVNHCIDKEVKRITKWVTQHRNDLIQLKEDSILYEETKKKIENYESIIAKYESQKINNLHEPDKLG